MRRTRAAAGLTWSERLAVDEIVTPVLRGGALTMAVDEVTIGIAASSVIVTVYDAERRAIFMSTVSVSVAPLYLPFIRKTGSAMG